MNFKELGLCPPLLQAIEEMGYEEPTPIQKMSIPPVLEGQGLGRFRPDWNGQNRSLCPTLYS